MSFLACDRAVPYQVSGVDAGPPPVAALDGPSPWDAGARPDAGNVFRRPKHDPRPVLPPPPDATVHSTTCKDLGPQDGQPVAKQQCVSAITVVEKNLKGGRTGVSIAAGEPPPKYGPSVHAAYWRCSPTCCPSKTGPPPPCSALKYATSNMAASPFKITSLGVQGVGPSLLLDNKGLPRISAAGPSDVRYALTGPGGWTKAKVGWSYYSPQVRTWLGLTKGGSPRVAWARLDGYVKEVQQAQPTATSWKVTKTKLPGMYGAWSYTASYDGAGAFHQAWVRSEQTMAPAKPKVYLEYGPPSKPVQVVEAIPDASFSLQDLFLDGAGKAHLVYVRRSPTWAKGQLVYATNATGKWKTTPFKLSTCKGSVEPSHAAVFADTQGFVHLALTGARIPGYKGVLMVGNNTKQGTWSFRVVDEGATGAVDIAVRYGVAFVGYFGADSFRVARVCD